MNDVHEFDKGRIHYSFNGSFHRAEITDGAGNRISYPSVFYASELSTLKKVVQRRITDLNFTIE